MYGQSKSLSIDDLFQLQSLLAYEQEERTKHIEACQNSPNVMHLNSIYRVASPSEISAAALAERQRLDQAIFNIRSLRDEYRRERTRQVQTYFNEYQRQALIRAALQEEEENYYRQCIAAAIEQRRAAQTWNDYLGRQKEEANDYSQYRSDQLAELLRQIFGEKQIEQPEDKDEDDDTMAEVWKCLSEQRQEPESVSPPDTSYEEMSNKALPPLSDHVVTLQDLVQKLASQPVLVDEQYDYSDEPKPSGSWQKTKPLKKEEVQRPKDEEKKKPFLPEHILTEAEPTPTKEFMTDSPLTEENQAFVNRIAAEQQHEMEDPKKASSLSILDEVNDQIKTGGIIARWKQVLSQPLTFTKQEETLLLMANTENNRAFLGAEDELVRLLLKLDTVESLGDQSIREYRRELVKECQNMLDQLDEYKQTELQKAVLRDQKKTKETSL